MNDRQLSKFLKGLPGRFGLISLAILFGLLEAGIATLEGIAEGPRMGIGRAYSRALSRKSFSEVYEALRQAEKESIRVALWRLQNKGLVKKKGRAKYQLSLKGFRLLKKIENLPPQVWDGKFRIVMFDIPEKQRANRQWLISQLLVSEYQRLQKSVFLGKYPIESKIFEEIHRRKLISFIRLIVVGEIDDESILGRL